MCRHVTCEDTEDMCLLSVRLRVDLCAYEKVCERGRDEYVCVDVCVCVCV